MTSSDPQLTDIYLVWSNEHAGWWRPARRGYTRVLEDAGQFTRDSAIEVCRNAIPGSSGLGMLPEIPVRLADIADMLKAHLGTDGVADHE